MSDPAKLPEEPARNERASRRDPTPPTLPEEPARNERASRSDPDHDPDANLTTAWQRYLETVRWFGGKGAGATVVALTPLPAWTPPDAVPEVRSEIATLEYPSGRTEWYHLLVSRRPAGSAPADAVVLGPDADGRLVLDAATDAEALEAFVAATHPVPEGTPVRVFRGEQSNTTIVLGDADLYKLFRKVEPGPNLDAEVLSALGGGTVPQVRGRLTASWPDGTDTDLGMVIERIPNAADGWELACQRCASGVSFAAEAEALGRALRDVHDRLAASFGTGERAGDEVADAMEARLAAAVEDAPALAEHAPALARAFGALRGRTLAVQRVHGDFHLGQTLASPRGWTIIDFEGEPAKTAAERRAPDTVWRDVAGMLRSFDYARSAHAEPTGGAAVAWASDARAAFLLGYCEPSEVDGDVLAAYEVDKAVYEVLYELRNRPDWVGIPMRAVQEVAAAATRSDDEKER